MSEKMYTLAEAKAELHKQSNDRMMAEFDREIEATRNRPLLIRVTSVCLGCFEFNGQHGEIGVDYGNSTRGTRPCDGVGNVTHEEEFDAVLIPKKYDIVGKMSYARVYHLLEAPCRTCGFIKPNAEFVDGRVCLECGTLHVASQNELRFYQLSNNLKYPVVLR